MFLIPITLAARDSGQHFKKNVDSDLSGISPIATSSVNRAATMSCTKLCQADDLCLTFTLSSGECRLYDRDEFTTEMVQSSGKTVFTLRYVDFISGPLFLNGDESNGGAPNIFPTMAVKKRGTVTKWKVKLDLFKYIYNLDFIVVSSY